MAVITQSQVEAELAARNSKIVIRTAQNYKQMGTIKIFNVGPWPWPVSMGGLGSFYIKPYDGKTPYTVVTGKGKDRDVKDFACSEPLEVWKQFPEGYHLDMNKMAEVINDGLEIAQSIVGCGKFQTPSSDLRRFGVFIAEGDLPTEEEIATANKKLKEYALALVAEANTFHQQGPNEWPNIGDRHRWAATFTNNGKLPWVRGEIVMSKCEGCGESVDPEAAICKTCRTVINEEKVKRLKIPGYEHIWKKEPPALKQPNA